MSNGSVEGKEFLGAGIAFPLRVEQGQIVMNSLEDHVRQSILLILQTAKGDRKIGTSISRYHSRRV